MNALLTMEDVSTPASTRMAATIAHAIMATQ